jgi:hypothetical protein
MEKTWHKTRGRGGIALGFSPLAAQLGRSAVRACRSAVRERVGSAWQVGRERAGRQAASAGRRFACRWSAMRDAGSDLASARCRACGGVCRVVRQLDAATSTRPRLGSDVVEPLCDERAVRMGWRTRRRTPRDGPDRDGHRGTRTRCARPAARLSAAPFALFEQGAGEQRARARPVVRCIGVAPQIRGSPKTLDGSRAVVMSSSARAISTWAGSRRARARLFHPASASAAPIEAAAPAVSPRAKRRRAVPGWGGAAFSVAFAKASAAPSRSPIRRRISPISERARPTWTSSNGSMPAHAPRARCSPSDHAPRPMRMPML